MKKPQRDWTADGKGFANSSRQYLACVSIVENMIRTVRVGDDPYLVARAIVSHLAHDAGLAPKAASEEPKP